jgi:hypothetical protein
MEAHQEVYVRMSLLSTSVTSKKLRGKSLLLYGTCIKEEYPNILAEFSKNRTPLYICLEEEHMNKVGFKLATILKIAKPKDITVLTIDGSPHCVQLHFAVEQARNISGVGVPTRYFVIEKGKIREISAKAIRMARHLSEIERTYRKNKLV